MPDLPTGTMTFLFTDIEGSTDRWERYPAEMRAALAQHDTLMRTAFSAHGGTVLQTAGDSFVVVFARPAAALAAALDSQRALRDAAAWPAPLGPLRVRAALHSGPGEQRADGYHAEFILNRLARLLAAGHGGQILATGTTRQLLDGATPAGVAWQDLGERWLKDLIRPLHVYQVLAPDLPHDFPPLKTLDAPLAPGVAALDGTTEVENPYKGLRAFGMADAPDFFGREALTERLVARLGEPAPLARFLAVVGPSGSGKSSVVRAGVLPALRRGDLPGSERWRLGEMIPGAEPLRELAAALAATSKVDAAALLADLQADEYGLVRVAQRLVGDTGPGTREQTALLLVVDQFEEVFTLVAEEPDRVHFLESLHRAVTAPDSPLRVIVTLRADFYDRPLLYPDPGELLRQRTEVVLPLTPEELARAISSPAVRVGVQVEAALVGAMIQDVAEQPGTLPLLEYTLTELFDRRENNRLTLAAYRASRGVLGALGRRAEAIYAGLAEPHQAVARQVFLRLVTLGEGGEDTRRRVRRAELAALPGEADTLDGVLEAFSRYRLLTFDREPGTGEATVEVAHEALIRSWGRLRDWLEASRAAVAVQRQLGEAAAEWARAGQEPSFLASGGRLAQFAALAAGGDVALTAAEQAYLAASQAAAEQQAAAERERQARELALQKRAASRLRVLLAGAVAFLLVAVGLSLVALDRSNTATANAAAAGSQQATAVANGNLAHANALTAVANQQEADAQRQQAQANFTHAEAQRLAAEASRLLTNVQNPSLVALLALRAGNIEHTPAGDAALDGALTLAYPRQVFSGTVYSKLLAPVPGYRPGFFGRYLLLGAGEKTVRLVDTRTGQELQHFAHPDLLTQGVLSPDATQALTTGKDNIARLWDLATGRELRQFQGDSGTVLSVEFSPDGKTVLTSSTDKTARLWDAGTGQELRRFTGEGQTMVVAHFIGAGRLIFLTTRTGTRRQLTGWDTQTGRQQYQFNYELGAVYSADGQYRYLLVPSATDKGWELWEMETGKRLVSLPLADTSSIAWGGYVSPDAKIILLLTPTGAVEMWDGQTGAKLREFAGLQTPGYAVALSPDGQLVAAGGSSGLALLWDARTGQIVRRLAGHTGSIRVTAFSPDGERLLILTDSTNAQVWDSRTPLGLPQFQARAGLASPTFSPDGKVIAVGGTEGSVWLWDAQTGQPVRRLAGHTNVVMEAVFTPDGKQMFSAGFDQTARLWDVATGQQLQRFDLPAKASGAAISPDGKYGSVGGDKPVGIGIYDLQAGTLVYTLTTRPPTAVYRIDFSPDGKYLVASSSDGIARLWDLQTRQVVREFKGHTEQIIVARFSPDGQYVLTGSYDKTARLWDVATGREVQRFVGHAASIWGGAFSHDGKYVATASDDRTARIWEVSSGQEVRRFIGHTDAVNSVAFSPDDRLLVTASTDGTSRLWYTDYREDVRYLCGKLLRDFTDEERAQYEIKDSVPTCPQK